MGTNIQTHTQTDRHTDIHKGNNNEMKYAKDTTAVKNNTLWFHLDAIRCFCTIIGEIIQTYNTHSLCKQPIRHLIVTDHSFIFRHL